MTLSVVSLRIANSEILTVEVSFELLKPHSKIIKRNTMNEELLLSDGYVRLFGIDGFQRVSREILRRIVQVAESLLPAM